MTKMNTLNSISFSILMTNYNNAEYIEEAIESVISQTYSNWELIIVDDFSYDNSIKKIKSYLSDSRIKLIIHNENMGYGKALITAIDKASNLIIGILDSDDKLDRNTLKLFAEAYQKNPEFGFIYSNLWVCDSKLQNPKINIQFGDIDPKKTNLLERRTSHFKTFRRELYYKTNGFDPNQSTCVDADIIFKLEEITKLKYIDKPLYYYRVHQKGVSRKYFFNNQLEDYISKLNAFNRRLNTNIPNLKISDLKKLYYKLTFFKIIKFCKTTKNFFKLYRIKDSIKNIKKKTPAFLIYQITEKYKSLKKKYLYWFEFKKVL